MIRCLPTAALIALLAVPALAAEGEKQAAKDTHEKNAPGTSVEMPSIISPMNDTDGRLAGYAYITCTIIAKTPDVAVAIRAKTPFIQDAFVRDVNKKPVALASDITQVDRPGVAQRFLADARKVMGSGKVVSLSITAVQMSPLHAGPPSDVPQDRLPQAGAAATQAAALPSAKTGS
ncbi:MAG TPA: hypothetical protein VG891_13460 [Rhizomicrobium sp.]|nr:hypothetical protein [Rhizomicrobium sp.]